MKDIVELIITLLFMILIIMLFFVFYGTPDVWDNLHNISMKYTSEVCK